MWKEKMASEAEDMEEEDKDRTRVLANQAVRHFIDMGGLDITPSRRGNVDIFIALQAKVSTE